MKGRAACVQSGWHSASRGDETVRAAAPRCLVVSEGRVEPRTYPPGPGFPCFTQLCACDHG